MERQGNMFSAGLRLPCGETLHMYFGFSCFARPVKMKREERQAHVELISTSATLSSLHDRATGGKRLVPDAVAERLSSSTERFLQITVQ